MFHMFAQQRGSVQENEQLILPVVLTPSASQMVVDQEHVEWRTRYRLHMDTSTSANRYRVPEGFFAVSYPATIFERTLENSRSYLAALRPGLLSSVLLPGNLAHTALGEGIQEWSQRGFDKVRGIERISLPVWGPGTDCVGIRYFPHEHRTGLRRLWGGLSMFLHDAVQPLTSTLMDEAARRNKMMSGKRLHWVTPIHFSLVAQHALPFECEVEVPVVVSQLPAHLKRALLGVRLTMQHRSLEAKELEVADWNRRIDCFRSWRDYVVGTLGESSTVLHSDSPNAVGALGEWRTVEDPHTSHPHGAGHLLKHVPSLTFYTPLNHRAPRTDLCRA